MRPGWPNLRVPPGFAFTSSRRVIPTFADASCRPASLSFRGRNRTPPCPRTRHAPESAPRLRVGRPNFGPSLPDRLRRPPVGATSRFPRCPSRRLRSLFRRRFQGLSWGGRGASAGDERKLRQGSFPWSVPRRDALVGLRPFVRRSGFRCAEFGPGEVPRTDAECLKSEQTGMGPVGQKPPIRIRMANTKQYKHCLFCSKGEE